MAYTGQASDQQFNAIVYGTQPSSTTIYRLTNTGKSLPFSFASITSVQITNNVLTCQAVNTYTAGDVVEFFSMTAPNDFLNGATILIASASGTQFTTNYVHADFGPSSEANGFVLGATFSTTLGVLAQEDPSVSGNFSPIGIDSALILPTATDVIMPFGNAPVVWPSGGFTALSASGLHEGAGNIVGTTQIQSVQVASNVLTVTPQGGNRFAPWIIGTTLTFSGLTSATFLNPGTVTSIQITTNVVTVTCANSFSNGQTILMKGLTGATFLNWVVLTITTATGTNFTAPFTHANYGPTADTGTANPIATVTSSAYSGGGSSAAVCTFGTHANFGPTTDTTGTIFGGTFQSVTGAVFAPSVNAATGGMDMLCAQVLDTGNQGHVGNVCGSFYTQMSDQSGYVDNQYAIYIQDQHQTTRSRSANVWAIYVQGGPSRFAGLATNIVSKTTTYTATVNDYTILCNGTFTVTLPTATTFLSGADPQGVKIGQIFIIKNTGTGTITLSSTANIDGATTLAISAQYQSVSVQWDGTQYWII
jgi:hypothetical protein